MKTKALGLLWVTDPRGRLYYNGDPKTHEESIMPSANPPLLLFWREKQKKTNNKLTDRGERHSPNPSSGSVPFSSSLLPLGCWPCSLPPGNPGSWPSRRSISELLCCSWAEATHQLNNESMAFPVSCFILLLSASRYCDEKRPLPHCPGASLSLSSPLFFKYLLSSYKKTWKAITSPFSRVFFSVLESPCNAAAKQDHKDRAANVFFFTSCLQKKGDRDFLRAKAFRSGRWKFKQTPQSSNSCCDPVISTRNQSLVQFQPLPRSRTKTQKGEGGGVGSEPPTVFCHQPKSHVP